MAEKTVLPVSMVPDYITNANFEEKLILKKILQSLCVKTMVIVMAKGIALTPNVIVYQDGNHLLIAMVSQY